MDPKEGYPQKLERVILHVDLNSFFASVEQQVFPLLRGKPVGVVKAKGRTCIIAASGEAKKFGVKTGTNIFEAKKLCPQIILVPANFDRYADITHRFIKICASYSLKCEVFSLDECFIDVGETEKFWGNAFEIAFDIKRRLEEEIGEWITCSIGISYNRLLAKLASSQIKPDGLFWITGDNALKVLDSSELCDICGIGFGLYNKLILLGIDNFTKLRACSLDFLYVRFGPFWSIHLYEISRGIDNSPVIPFSEIPSAKSVGRTYTTHRSLYKKKEIYKLVRNLCEESAAKARKMNLAGRYVGFSVRSGDKHFTGHKTLKKSIDDGKLMFDICKVMLDSWKVKYVRFCGVTLGMLSLKNYMPNFLFKSDVRRENLTATIDEINNKYGDYTVYPGQLLGMKLIRPEVNGFFGDKKYRLNFLRS